LLVKYFVRMRSEKSGVAAPAIDHETMKMLDRYRWPGNVRELENTVDRLLALAQGTLLTPDALPIEIRRSYEDSERAALVAQPELARPDGDLPLEIRIPAPDFGRKTVDLEAILAGLEQTYILKALEHAGGVKKRAADLLGITFRSLRYRMKKIGLESGDGDTEGD
ncbi:MAG: helix-turn-helix domain-containing protein, partial [Bdellovibrionota bacterium]